MGRRVPGVQGKTVLPGGELGRTRNLIALSGRRRPLPHPPPGFIESPTIRHVALWGHFPTPRGTPRPAGVTFGWSRSGSHLPTGEEGQCVISNHLSGLQRNWGDWTCGSSRHTWHQRLPHVDWLPQPSAILTATLTRVDRCDRRCLTFQETCLPGRYGERRLS